MLEIGHYTLQCSMPFHVHYWSIHGMLSKEKYGLRTYTRSRTPPTTIQCADPCALLSSACIHMPLKQMSCGLCDASSKTKVKQITATADHTVCTYSILHTTVTEMEMTRHTSQHYCFLCVEGTDHSAFPVQKPERSRIDSMVLRITPKAQSSAIETKLRAAARPWSAPPCCARGHP